MVSRATRVTCHIYYHLQVEASDNEYYFETSLAHYFFHLVVCVCAHLWGCSSNLHNTHSPKVHPDETQKPNLSNGEYTSVDNAR